MNHALIKVSFRIWNLKVDSNRCRKMMMMIHIGKM